MPLEVDSCLATLPRWSVVVPLYNKEAFIQATLRSVLEQAGADLEVVVVDDGSSDGSAQRVLELADPRVRLIHQANAGVSAARNRGVADARGEWVVCLDADDLLHPQALEAYQQLSTRYPQASVLGGQAERVDHAVLSAYAFSELPHPLPMFEVNNLPQFFVRRGLPFSSSSVALKREFLLAHQLGFPEGESMGEDLDLWLRAAEHSPVACAALPLVLYRVGLPSSLIGSYQGLELLPVWQRLRERALSEAMPEALRPASLRLAAEAQVTQARRLAKAGQRRQAWQHLRQARAAARGHRWWVTWAALASGSSALIARLR